jgi:protein TonB
MTGPIMPAARRRFLAMLWLSLALHALVIGLTQLPSPVRVPASAQFDVEIERPESAATPAQPKPEPGPAARPIIQTASAMPPRPQASAAPGSPLSASRQPADIADAKPEAAPLTQSVPAPATAAAVRESPGPVLNVPLLMDARYYTARELDTQPTALRKPEPVYPPGAEERGLAGRVLVRLHLEADGAISRTEVVSVAPGGAYGEMFRKATLDSLERARFRAARRDGQPVRAVVEIPVVFDPDR